MIYVKIKTNEANPMPKRGLTRSTLALIFLRKIHAGTSPLMLLFYEQLQILENNVTNDFVFFC